MAKIVRPEFKEQNATNWKDKKPTSQDVIEKLIETYRNEARWRKAVQHLRDAGELQGEMRDIPLLTIRILQEIVHALENPEYLDVKF